MSEVLQIQIRGDASQPTVVYLPGLHGDWTLIQRFYKELEGKVRFVEITYPRTTEWSLRDYARAVEDALLVNDITHGWVLAESFGSQVAWELLAANRHAQSNEQRRSQTAATEFRATGLILAGGFVKYPRLWQVRFAERRMHRASDVQIRRFLGLYARYARIRHWNDPEAMRWVKEFVERRTREDCDAMVHRMKLIRENDPRPIAEQTSLPVCHLFGLIDPVVPGFMTKSWLRRLCPGYRETKVILPADHNVLDRAVKSSARQVLKWVSTEAARRTGSAASPESRR